MSKLRVESSATPEYVVTISRSEIDKNRVAFPTIRGLKKLQYEEETENERASQILRGTGYPLKKRDRFL